jgi:MarR family
MRSCRSRCGLVGEQLKGGATTSALAFCSAMEITHSSGRFGHTFREYKATRQRNSIYSHWNITSQEKLRLIGTDTFLAMWSVWVDVMPKALAREDPDLLLRLLHLADVSTGVSQSTLQRALKVNQSKISKLTAKLVKQKWLEVRPQADDRRFLFVRTSQRAKNSMVALQTRLSSLLPLVQKPTRRRGLVAPRSGHTLYDLLQVP